MTFMTIKNIFENQEPLNIAINCFKDKVKVGLFLIKFDVQMFGYEEKLDEQWHVLALRFKPKKKIIQTSRNDYKLKIYIDNFMKPISPDNYNHRFFYNNHYAISYG